MFGDDDNLATSTTSAVLPTVVNESSGLNQPDVGVFEFPSGPPVYREWKAVLNVAPVNGPNSDSRFVFDDTSLGKLTDEIYYVHVLKIFCLFGFGNQAVELFAQLLMANLVHMYNNWALRAKREYASNMDDVGDLLFKKDGLEKYLLPSQYS